MSNTSNIDDSVIQQFNLDSYINYPQNILNIKGKGIPLNTYDKY